jgi:hypothetical protein
LRLCRGKGCKGGEQGKTGQKGAETIRGHANNGKSLPQALQQPAKFSRNHSDYEIHTVLTKEKCFLRE